MTCDMTYSMTMEDWNEMLEERKLAMELEDDYDSDCESEEKENCNICDARLNNHNYGNVCKKHIPSYALWDDDLEDMVEEFKEPIEVEDAPPPCVLNNLELPEVDWTEWDNYIDYNGGYYDSGYEDDMYEDEGFLEMF